MAVLGRLGAAELVLLIREEFPALVPVPDDQLPKLQTSRIVNDKGRYHSLSSPSTFAGSPVMLGRAAE
jgi:hypothetical protein